MESIEWARFGPGAWSFDRVPDVDDVRPGCCPHCAAAARRGDRIVLHGHGVRPRSVVVAPATVHQEEVVRECWSRRYRCTACDAVTVVLPDGVMPRFLYSAAAMVMAFLLTASPPVGRGLDDAAAYDAQGMLKRLRTLRADYLRLSHRDHA